MEKEKLSSNSEQVSNDKLAKPKSAGNKNFRKHNKLGFYRFMQRKKKKNNK